MEENNEVIMALDVSTQTIGVCILVNDGSEYGKIAELTHVNPKCNNKIKGTEELFIKKRIFEGFLEKHKSIGINRVVIEEPLISSNNTVTCSILLRYNGMISDSIYNILGVVPEYISSHDARKYSFPDLVSVRKYDKEGREYDSSKVIKSIRDAKFVLFGGYPWEVDKKTIMQGKVAEIFPNIEWVYDKNGELRKENFDATDSYIAALGWLNKKRNGEIEFKVSNVTPTISDEKMKIDYDVEYWNRKEHRVTYLNK